MNNNNNDNNEGSNAAKDLEVKVDRLIELFTKFFPLSNTLLQASDDPSNFTVDLVSEIEELDDYNAILETLNIYADPLGYAFKKGPMTKKKDQIPTALTIVCRMYNRNPDKASTSQNFPTTQSRLIKEVNCRAFYRFHLNNDGTVLLTTYNQSHNHGPNLGIKSELSQAMKVEISKFSKFTRVSTIRDHLELTFHCRLSYNLVYNEFRRNFPRFGREDCVTLINFLKHENAEHFCTLDDENSLCKLIFQTQRMRANFENFGDIILTDTTYNTNFYAIPLVIFSGVDSNFKNVLFAMSLVNDEKKETYTWLLKKLSEWTLKRPSIFLTDDDPSLGSALQDVFPNIPHRLCGWHLARNLRNHFKFIKAENQELKQKIVRLPFIKVRTTFDNDVQEILQFLEHNKFPKSVEYIQGLLKKKEKWAEAYFLPYFDGGLNTTSRAESWNSTVKRYLSSHSQVSDLIDFIHEIEKTEFLDGISFTRDALKYLELDPLVSELKVFLATKLYYKELDQYAWSKRYESKVLEETLDSLIYEVYFLDGSTEERKRYLVTVADKISCSCFYFNRYGLICRHIFHICCIKNIKSIKKLLIMDRWKKSSSPIQLNHFSETEKAQSKGKNQECILGEELDLDNDWLDEHFRAQSSQILTNVGQELLENDNRTKEVNSDHISSHKAEKGK